MTSATLEKSEVASAPGIGERLADKCRQAAKLSHDARLIRTAAEDAIERSIENTRRAVRSIRRRANRLSDLRYEAVHQVRRHPLASVGLAAAAGLAVGAAAVWIGNRFAHRTHGCRDLELASEVEPSESLPF